MSGTMGEGDSDEEFFQPTVPKKVKKVYSPKRDRIVYDYKYDPSSESDEDDVDDSYKRKSKEKERERVRNKDKDKDRGRERDRDRNREKDKKSKQHETKSYKSSTSEDTIPTVMQVPVAVPVPMAMTPSYPMMSFPNQASMIPMALPMGVLPPSMPMMMNLGQFPTIAPQQFGTVPACGPSGAPPRGPPPRPPFPIRQPFESKQNAETQSKQEVSANATISKPPQIRKDVFSTSGKNKAGSSSSKSEMEAAGPVFRNDGSFMEMFKKMQKKSESLTEPKKEETAVRPPPPVAKPLVGKRRGGRVLKTGVVQKPKMEVAEEETTTPPKDAWSIYMAEVKKYRETNCEEERKTRALVK